MTDKEKIELELLQLIDENAEPQGGIVLIEETVNNIKYIHFEEDEMHFVNTKDVEVYNNRKMVKSNLILKSLESRYRDIFCLPFDNRN